MSYLREKEVVAQEVYETPSDLPKIGQGELLTIDGGPVFAGDGMFEKNVYILLFVFC